MIKLTSKFNNSLSQILGYQKNKYNIPKVKKPLVSYMQFLEKEPSEFGSNFGLGSLLSDITKAYLLSKTEEKQDVRTEYTTKTEVKVETKNETIIENKAGFKEKSNSAHYTSSYSYKHYKEPLVKRVLSTIGQVLTYPIEMFEELKNNFVYKKQIKIEETNIKRELLKAIVQENPFLEVTLGKEITSKILSSQNMSLEKVEKLIAQSQNTISIRNQQELKLRKDFEAKIRKYRSMFTPDDIMPKLHIFKGWQKAPIEKLKELFDILDACISHQEIIISLKKKYLLGIVGYLTPREKQNIKLDNDKSKIQLKRYKQSDDYRKELDRLCGLFIKYSQELETPIKDFHHVSTRFFDSAKKKIEEIFELKEKWYFKWLEKIPKLGLVPKSIRVTGQINLTRCIMKDYKEINNKYIQQDINPTITQYNQIYNKIKDFTLAHRKYLSQDDIDYSDKALTRMTKIREKHLLTYKKLFDFYSKGGCNISNICNKVRIQGLISLVTKTITTFGTPF